MTFVITGPYPEPTLSFDVMDAATQVPIRVTIATGIVVAQQHRTGVHMVSTTETRDSLGFYVPGLEPVPPGPDPVIVTELSLSQVGVVDARGLKMHGVGDVKTQLAPDPQRPGMRLAYLSFSAVGGETMGLRYRVTMYRPRS